MKFTVPILKTIHNLFQNQKKKEKSSWEALKKIVISWGVLFDDIERVNLQNSPEMISRMHEVWKSLATKIPEEILWRSIFRSVFYTTKKVCSDPCTMSNSDICFVTAELKNWIWIGGSNLNQRWTARPGLYLAQFL